MVRFALGLSSVALLVLGAMGGCSSNDETTPTTGDGGAEEASVGKDSGKPVPVDSGNDDGGSTCAPGDVSGFKATWKAPSGIHQKVCTPEQIALLADCVWSHPGRDDTACTNFFKAAANKACLGCAYTPTSGKTLGAVVSNGTSVQVNYAGCIAVTTGDTTANGCGAKVQAAQLCQDEACVENCPVPSDDTGAAFNAFLACQEKAAAEGCKSYSDEAACTDTAVADGGPASVCNPDTQDFGERVSIYAELFCGGLGGDGGTDASTDASDAATTDAADDASTTDAGDDASDAASDAPADG